MRRFCLIVNGDVSTVVSVVRNTQQETNMAVREERQLVADLLRTDLVFKGDTTSVILTRLRCVCPRVFCACSS